MFYWTLLLFKSCFESEKNKKKHFFAILDFEGQFYLKITYVITLRKSAMAATFPWSIANTTPIRTCNWQTDTKFHNCPALTDITQNSKNLQNCKTLCRLQVRAGVKCAILYEMTVKNTLLFLQWKLFTKPCCFVTCW